MSEVIARVDGKVFLNGKLAITAAGTPQRITATSTYLTSGVTIRARGGSVGTANTGLAYVGNSATGALAANAFDLAPGESTFIETNDLNTVWIDMAVSGEIISWIAI